MQIRLERKGPRGRVSQTERALIFYVLWWCLPLAHADSLDAGVPVDHLSGRAADEGPNVLLVMTDDVGFAASTAFGGSLTTPTLDALADEGVRYNNFHVTAQCSPTRAA